MGCEQDHTLPRGNDEHDPYRRASDEAAEAWLVSVLKPDVRKG